MIVSGWCTSAVNTHGSDLIPWSNVANAEGATDGNCALVSSSMGPTDFTDTLGLSGATTSVPIGSTITGFGVTIYRFDNTGGSKDDTLVVSLTDGTNTWTVSTFSGSVWPSSIGSGDSFGATAGSSGLPGTMVTAGSTLSIGCSMVVNVVSGHFGVTANVDSMAWGITYTPSTAPMGGPIMMAHLRRPILVPKLHLARRRFPARWPR